MEKYELAYFISDNGEKKYKSVAKIEKEQYEMLISYFSFCDYYTTCRCMKSNVIDNGNELKSYLISLKEASTKCKEITLEKYCNNTNRLLINFLGSIYTFVNVLKCSVSRLNKDKVTEFENYNRSLYDAYFGYRFFTRLRNYSIHNHIPLQSVKCSFEGISIECVKTVLLKDSKLCNIKGIELLPDYFEIGNYISETLECVLKLYLKAISFIRDDIEKCKCEISNICDTYKIPEPIVLRLNVDSNDIQICEFPMYLIEEYAKEAIL